MAQHEDLDIFGTISAAAQYQQVEYVADKTVETRHEPILAADELHRSSERETPGDYAGRVFGTHTLRGATVIGMARREALLKDLRDGLQRVSPQSDTIVCDVSDVARFRADLAEVEYRFGRVDVLINDAGIHETTPAGQDTFAVHQRIMATNYFAAVAGTLAVVSGMLTRGRGTLSRCPRTRRAHPRSARECVRGKQVGVVGVQ